MLDPQTHYLHSSVHRIALGYQILPERVPMVRVALALCCPADQYSRKEARRVLNQKLANFEFEVLLIDVGPRDLDRDDLRYIHVALREVFDRLKYHPRASYPNLLYDYRDFLWEHLSTALTPYAAWRRATDRLRAGADSDGDHPEIDFHVEQEGHRCVQERTEENLQPVSEIALTESSEIGPA